MTQPITNNTGIPIRTLMIAPFVLLIALAVGLTSYLSFYKGREAVDELATRLRTEITDQIQNHLDSHLSTPVLVNRINANALQQGLLDPRDQNAMERYFWEQLQLFEGVSSIYFGNHRGGLVDAGREVDDKGQYVIVTDGFSSGPFRKYATDNRGNRTNLLLTVPDFDARIRPWYRLAREKGQPTWSDIYILFSGQDMAIAASHPVFDSDNRLLGVFSNDLFLSQFNHYLRGLDIASNGEAFVIERSGLLVASSTGEPLILANEKGGAKKRLAATESRHPLISEATRRLLVRFGELHSIDGDYDFEFRIGSERHLAQVTPFRTESGLDWLSVVVIPESDFASGINTNALSTLLLILVTLVLAIGSAVLGTRWMTRPILRLNQAAQSLADGEPPYSVRRSRVREIDHLTRSFNKMALHLRRSLDSLTGEIGERKRAEAALNRQHQRLQNIIEGTRVGTWEWNVQSGETRFDERWAGIVGHTLQELEPLSIETRKRLTHPDDLVRSEQMLKSHFDGDLEHYECEIRMRHKAGHWVWVNDRGKLISRTNQGEPLLMAGTHTDVSDKKRAEENLRLSASVFENTAEGVVITDPDGTILDINRAFTEITGYSRQEAIGRNPGFLKSGRHDADFYREMWNMLGESGQWRGEIWNRRRDGSLYPEWLTISKVEGDTGQLTHYVGVFSDISQIKQSQDQLRHLAHHDALTGLPNRLLLRDRLENAIRHAERKSTSLAVMFLDLDHFKHINDSLGHNIGDQLLQAVAAGLQETLRREDTVCRIGGDEFVMLLDEIDEPENAAVAAQKILALFERPFVMEHHEIRITPSLGICLYPRDGRKQDTLLRNADAAMYRAKEAGRNCYHFYTEELTRRAIDRVQLENSLRSALEQEALFLAYQPQVDLDSGRVIGVEALLRWTHPDQGPISPARFIPLAEESGLIHPLGEWVLRSACRQGRAWIEQEIEFGRMSVNIAGPQLQRGSLPQVVQRILEETGFPPSRLELEVTESFIMQEAENAIDQLKLLREMGITLSIDDFGTGYSSLSYLKRLPVHRLKIDQSFVRDIPADPNDMAITAAVLAMGQSLDLKVIAEGVETEAQAAFLKAHQCHEVQGYLYSRPVSADEIETLLEQRQPLFDTGKT
ncbi:MAG: EAL domain-containing protein [Sedimenticola sp.]|nr:EAL domain-containing protein [Sedimenticola sp.]